MYETRGLTRRLQIHYFLLFAPFAIALTYQNLYFKRIGFSESQIGTLNAVAAILTVLSPPLWGFLADRVQDKRKPLAVLLLVSGATYPMFLMVHSFTAAALFQVLFTIFMAPCIALTDAMALEHVARTGGDYARIRLWGSVGFICTLLAFCFVLGGTPVGAAQVQGSLTSTFIAFGVLRLLGGVWVFRLPGGKASEARKGAGGEWRALFNDRAFLLFLVAAFLSQAALKSYYVFFSIYLDGLHVPDNLKGIFWDLGVASEVVFMIFAARLMRILGVRWMLALGLAGGALRLFLFSYALPMPLVAFAQCLHAFAFGATHIASMTFITASVPKRLSASGQTLYAAVSGGLAGAVGSHLSGNLSEAYSIPYAFRTCAFLAAAAALLALFLPERRLESGIQRERSTGREGSHVR